MREVRKALTLKKAVSVIVAPNVEQMDVTGGVDNHLADIMVKCEEQHVPLIFALSRKRIGQIYGGRKKVSAVALLDIHGVEVLHGSAVSLMVQGRSEFEQYSRAGFLPPVDISSDEDAKKEVEK